MFTRERIECEARPKQDRRPAAQLACRAHRGRRSHITGMQDIRRKGRARADSRYNVQQAQLEGRTRTARYNWTRQGRPSLQQGPLPGASKQPSPCCVASMRKVHAPSCHDCCRPRRLGTHWAPVATPNTVSYPMQTAAKRPPPLENARRGRRVGSSAPLPKPSPLSECKEHTTGGQQPSSLPTGEPSTAAAAASARVSSWRGAPAAAPTRSRPLVTPADAHRGHDPPTTGAAA